MTHLTDAQFSECLTAAAPVPAIQAHLAQCDECRMELGVFLASMDDFSAAAMEWSKAQPVVSPRAKIARTATLAAPLRWAVAAALIAAVGVPVAVRHERQGAAVVAGIDSDAGDSAAQIAQDNRLLESVDVALGQNDPSPFEEYRLDDSTKGSRARTQSRIE